MVQAVTAAAQTFKNLGQILGLFRLRPEPAKEDGGLTDNLMKLLIKLRNDARARKISPWPTPSAKGSRNSASRWKTARMEQVGGRTDAQTMAAAGALPRRRSPSAGYASFVLGRPEHLPARSKTGTLPGRIHRTYDR